MKLFINNETPKRKDSFAAKVRVLEEHKMEMMKMIERINHLAHKKKTIGLTDEELAEQKQLYRMYLDNIRGQLKATLDNIEIVDKQPEENVQH